MCDGLAVLSPEHLSFCISMLGQFGQQVIMNIGPTVAKNGDTYRQSGVRHTPSRHTARALDVRHDITGDSVSARGSPARHADRCDTDISCSEQR